MNRSLSAIFTIATVVPSLAFAANPANDRLMYTGESNTCTSASVTDNAGMINFTCVHPEGNITYQLNLNGTEEKGGYLTIHEVSSDSNPINLGPTYRDSANNEWFPWDLYKKSTKLSHSISGKTLTVNYKLVFNSTPTGTHYFNYEVTLNNKALRIRLYDPSGLVTGNDNFSGTYVGKSTSVESPVVLKIMGMLGQSIALFRDGTDHAFLAIALDKLNSNASSSRLGNMVNAPKGPDWVQFAEDTAASYKKLSNGMLAASFDDSFVVIAANKLKDAVLTSSAPISPYVARAKTRMYLDLPGTDWTAYSNAFTLYDSLGAYNLTGYFFDKWAGGGIGPNWGPATNPTLFTPMVSKGLGLGYEIGAYTAFNTIETTNPQYNPNEIARDANGNLRLTAAGTPVLAYEAAASWGLSQSQQLKSNYGFNSLYVDIDTYANTYAFGNPTDALATSSFAKTMRQGAITRKNGFNGMRGILSSGLLGEGSVGDATTNAEFLWYGYVDSVQDSKNTGGLGATAGAYPAGSPFAPTNFPLVPHGKYVQARHQANQGNGFYDRFFGPSDGPGVVNMSTGIPYYPLTKTAVQLYRIHELTYGDNAFALSNGMHDGLNGTSAGYLNTRDLIGEYYMTQGPQITATINPPLEVYYFSNGVWRTFEEVIFASETLDSFRHAFLKVVHKNGYTAYYNHSSTAQTITDAGVTYILPAKTGWYAAKSDGTIRCFQAQPAGLTGDIGYCYFAGQYKYFDGNGVATSFDGLTNANKKSTWESYFMNVHGTEDAAGHLSSTKGPMPAFKGLTVTPSLGTMKAGEQMPVFVLATTENSGNKAFRDVTRLVSLHSTTGAATVNSAGVVTAVRRGSACIVATAMQGSIYSPPMCITVQ